MTRALVTGATGLVGANLVDVLNRAGWQVRILRRPTSRLDALEGLAYEDAVGDILDRESLLRAMEGVDVVFHVAGAADHWRTTRERLYRVNVDGTRTVVQAALEARISRLVYTSSIAAIGPAPDPAHPVDETHRFTLSPEIFPYGHSKWLAEKEVRKGVERGLDAVIVNPAIVIGPRDSHLITGSMFITLLRSRGLPFAPRGGSGVVAARDVALGHLRAAEMGRTGERYILSAENMTHKELACMLADALGVPGPRWELPSWMAPPLATLVEGLRALGIKVPTRGSTLRMSVYWFYVNNEKSRRELGLTYGPLPDAVQEALSWLREHHLLTD